MIGGADLYLTEDVKYIIERLNAHGHRADVVGGPVRDFLLGKLPWDYDITTSATPDEVKAAFAGERIVETGIKHGTVTLVRGGENYEITTYRIDGEYKDSRHPESVEFTKNLEEDLARRDFTMNAIAYNPKDKITDRFGGEADIKARIIRAVGDAEKRFCEDALRILRGIRFSAVLGFEIEEKTDSAMRRCAHLLKNVSAERIFVELKKLISGDYSYEVIEKYRDILAVFLPELFGAKLPDRERYYKCSPPIRLISLFYGLEGSAAAYREAMSRLRTDSATRDVGTLVLSSEEKYDTSTDLGIKLMMSELGAEVAAARLELEFAVGQREYAAVARVSELTSERCPYRISDLDISGADALALGLRGSAVGASLKELLLGVMTGKVENRRAALISELEKIKAGRLQNEQPEEKKARAKNFRF